MKCSKCGAELQIGDQFCLKCGTSVGKTVLKTEASEKTESIENSGINSDYIDMDKTVDGSRLSEDDLRIVMGEEESGFNNNDFSSSGKDSSEQTFSADQGGLWDDGFYTREPEFGNEFDGIPEEKEKQEKRERALAYNN